MILRVLWFGSVFCLSAWVGGHAGAYPIAIRPLDPTAAVSAIDRPFHTIVLALGGH